MLVVAITAGLLIRLAILSTSSSLGVTILDEQQYSHIARSLMRGHGFAWAPGEPTSIRPPLYPGLLAAVWTAVNSESLQIVRFLHILLSLATAGLVYVLGRRVYGRDVGMLAAAVVWLYPTLIFANFLILTETLFTLLLVAFLLVAVLLVQRPTHVTALGCGAVLGLAALARSVLWPLPILLCPLLLLVIRGALGRRIVLSMLVLVGYAAVVGPWAIRNTRLQGVVTIVDTMGGMNLRMGNYEHTPDDRMWDAVGLTGEKSWVRGIEADFPGQTITEGQKEKWAQRKAIEYIRENPGQTLRRAVIKFADFWGLEREFMAGVRSGFFTVPTWFAIVASAAIVLGYAVVASAGVAGIWLASPQDWRLHALLLLPLILIMGVHTVVFGHSRYHVPLVPILALYGAAFAVHRPAFAHAPRWAIMGSIASVTILLAIWVRQVVVVDLPRITSFLGL